MDNYELKKSDYFNSLPTAIQESVMQMGLKFDDDESLRKFVENIKEKI